MTTTAYHVNWTAPARSRLGETELSVHHRPRLPLEELVTLVHSVYSWRAFHGGIQLVTDKLGAEHFDSVGLTELYDDVHTWLDDIDPDEIDPSVFFAAGKFEVFRRARKPFAMIDTDFYLRRPVEPPAPHEFVFSHWEQTSDVIYPEPRSLPMAAGYVLPDMDYSGPACNMSLAWFGDVGHAHRLADAGFAFAAGNGGDRPGHRVHRMAFAEQRLAPAIARELGVDMRPLTDRLWVTETGMWEGPTHADVYHHTWISKFWFVNHPELRPSFWHYLIRDLCFRQPEGGEWLANHLGAGPIGDSLRALLEGKPVAHDVVLDWRILEEGA